MNRLLQLAAIASLFALSACATAPTIDAPPALAGESDPARIWSILEQSNARYVAEADAPAARARRHALAEKQSPRAVVLACSDSRCSPDLVFRREAGDLFVVRTAGNVADPVDLGSIEYSVAVLGAPVLLVVGHEHCGAVKATLAGKPTGSPHIDAIVARVQPAADATPDTGDHEKHLSDAVHENARRSARDVVARSAILRDAVRDGKLTVFVAVQDLETGRVTRLE